MRRLPIQAVMEGILTCYAGSELPHMVTGMWAYGAPLGTSEPYITLHLVDGRPEWTMDDKTSERQLVQFSVWSESDSPRECYEILEALFRTYDEAPIPVAGYALIRVARRGYRVVGDPDGGYHGSVDYSILTQEE